jgi:hypothetical protein
MNWKTIETVKIVNRDNEVENLEIQSDGNFYKIQNEFGNLSFEFDVSSGFELANTLREIIDNDISDEITNFLNEQDQINSSGIADGFTNYEIPKQVDLFPDVDNSNKNKKGMNIKFNSKKDTNSIK